MAKILSYHSSVRIGNPCLDPIDCSLRTEDTAQSRDIALTSAEVKRIIRLVGYHPLVSDQAKLELLESINRTYGPLPSLRQKLKSYSDLAMHNLVQFCSTREIQSSSQFQHADIIARRESKCEVTLLIDLAHLDFLKLDAFLVCPVDKNLILSARTSGQRLWQPSLIFKHLADSVTLEKHITAQCSACHTETVFRDINADYCCSNLECPALPASRLIPEIHPGGNRRYFGPRVPDFGRVWIGITEKFEHRSDRIGIIKATVYSLFHDPADVNRRGRVVLKFPTASPRVQWTIFPYK